MIIVICVVLINVVGIWNGGIVAGGFYGGGGIWVGFWKMGGD